MLVVWTHVHNQEERVFCFCFYVFIGLSQILGARIYFSKDLWLRVAASHRTSTLASCCAAQLLRFPLVYGKDPALPLCFCSGELFLPLCSSGTLVHRGDFVFIRLLTVKGQCKATHESELAASPMQLRVKID